MSNISIIGSGPVGTLAALFLHKRGFPVDVYDKRPNPHNVPHAEGRSINLALSERGLAALRAIGMEDEVLKHAVPMFGRQVHDAFGGLSFQPYGREGECIRAVSRNLLGHLLSAKAGKQRGINLYYDTACTSYDPVSRNATFIAKPEGEVFHRSFDIVIGADGAFSSVRNGMMHKGRFNYSQQFLEYGYKEFHIPALPGNRYALTENALHIWPRGHFMLIALPNTDGSFTVTLFLPFEGSPESFAELHDVSVTKTFLETCFPDLVPLVADFTEQFLSHPTGSLVTVKCHPWAIGNTCLLGDAAHAIVPFYGQGLNAGFEDCLLLDSLMETGFTSWEALFEAFQEIRKPDADAIAELALQNFIEMRDLVSNPDFIEMKKLEARLHQYAPDVWIPQYSLVTFTRTPYSEALKKGRIQQGLLQRYKGISDKKDLDKLLDEYKLLIA